MAIADIFRRVLFPVREKPVSTDWNQLQERLAETIRAVANSTYAKGSAFSSFSARSAVSPATGFHGASFFVRPDASNTPLGVELVAGFGLSGTGPTSAANIDACEGANWDGALGMGVPMVLSSAQGFTIPTLPPAGSSRIDIIEVRPQYTPTDSTTTAILNTSTLVYDAVLRNKSLTWDLRGLTGNVNAGTPSTACISYVKGAEAVGALSAATQPTTTAGYTKVARINLDNSAGTLTAISQGLIADFRPLLFPGNIMHTGMRLAFPGRAAGLTTGLVGMRQKCPGVWMTAGAAEGIAPSTGVSYQIEVYVIGGDLAPGLGAADECGIPTIFPFNCPRVPRMVISPGYDFADATLRSKLAGTYAGWTNYGGTASIAVGQPYLSFVFELQHPAGSAIADTENAWISLMVGRT